MEIQIVAQKNTDDEQIIQYKSNKLFSYNDIIEILKLNQVNNAILGNCYCSAYMETGGMCVCEYKSIDEINIIKDFEGCGSFIDFSATYIDENTKEYLFDLYIAINSRYIKKYIDKKKLGTTFEVPTIK